MNINYLAGIPEHRVQEAVIEGIEFLRSRDASMTSFSYDAVVGQVARVLIPAKSVDAAQAWSANQVGFQGAPQGTGPEHDDNRKLLGALWQLVGHGVLFPRLAPYQRDGHPHVVQLVTLTEKGERLFSNASQHPLHPGFMKRFVQKAPTATHVIVAHLEDAVECLRVGLLRPTLMMVGVANEETIRTVHSALVHLGKCTPPHAQLPARVLLTQVNTAVLAWTPGNSGKKADELHRITLAVSTVECIRDERNNAAHPSQRVSDSAHIEALLMLAGHHLPVLWEQLVAPAVQAGFQL
jgi:hypothetical protein